MRYWLSIVQTAVASLLLVPGLATATLFTYSETAPSGQAGMNTPFLESVSATFDDVTGDFHFQAVFSATGDGLLPTAFSLTINDGPVPRRDDTVALFFLDATQSTPLLTAAVYDASATTSSLANGPFLITNTDLPNGTADVFVTDSGGQRTMGFNINSFALNAIANSFGMPDFDAASFDDVVGIWLHWFVNASVSYGMDGSVMYSDERARFGYYDRDNIGETPEVPEPATLSLLALGGLCAAGMRRRRIVR